MSIPNAAIKYGLGVTYVNNAGSWTPLKNAWIKDNSGNWAPIKTGWVAHDDGTWQRVYPTPSGVLTASPSTLTNDLYQYHYTATQSVTLTNTGDYDLVINTLDLDSNVGNYTSYIKSTPVLPLMLRPKESTGFSFNVYGANVGNFNGNIVVTSNVGYLGTVVNNIPVSTTVRPDINGIGVVSPTPFSLTVFQYDDVQTYSKSDPGTYTYTVPMGVDTLSFNISGGGGGGGGDDSHGGSGGYPGTILGGRLSVTTGDTITVYVGGGGGAGSSHTWGGGGGAGGTSSSSYGGGRGGYAGPIPSSGSGGGGGAATVITKNGTVIAVAAGGGGGGGGGDHSYGRGQYLGYNGSTTGSSGADKGGDGGGGGGGGGGYQGGVGGGTYGGDDGAYSGSDGLDLVPSGWSSTKNSNGGGHAGGAGGSGYMTLTEYSISTSAQKQFTIQNTGTGKDLTINSITSVNGLVFISGLTTSTVGYDFNTFTGNTASFTVTPKSLTTLGTYNDIIRISSDALNAPTYDIPVSILVTTANGSSVYEEPGKYTFTVPAHVHSMNMLVVGAGGAGGAGYSGSGGGHYEYTRSGNYMGGTFGDAEQYTRTWVSDGGGGGGASAGGGGGAGGTQQVQSVKVIPGETLTVIVGGETPGNTYFGRRVWAVSNGGWGSFLNTYGVWVSSDGSNPVNSLQRISRLWNAPYTGTYILRLSTDDVGYVNIDSTTIASHNFWGDYATVTFTAAVGNRVIDMYINNSGGGPGGIGVAIYDSTDTNVLWSSRSVLDPSGGLTGFESVVTGSFGTIISYGGSGGGSASQTATSDSYWWDVYSMNQS